MQIAVHNIDARGRDIRFDLGNSEAAAATSEVLEGVVSELNAELHFDAQARTVHVTGSVRAAATRTCERCGEETLLELMTQVDLSYVPEANEAEQDVALSDGELDVGWYRDGIIKPVEVLSEALALALPDRVACADVASCDARTADLLASRGQSGHPGHPAFAALKHFD